MDLFEELESMATNARDDYDVDLEPSEEEILRWQGLFDYTYLEAVEQIRFQKSDYSRYRVSDDHWDLVMSEKEVQGYSRDAYEHWIIKGGKSAICHGQRRSIEPITSGSRAQRSSYLVLLEGVLNTPKIVQDAASLSETPRTIQAASETGDAAFCAIDGAAKQSIEYWLSQEKSLFKPTFVRLSKAKKDLDPHSIYPTLGLESTLPQHRFSPNADFDTTLPQHRDLSDRATQPVLQDEYPIWYFFYGTLADPDFLARLLSLSEPPILIPASISGGLIKTWQGKYKALVNGASDDCVHGSAFEVISREQEDALLIYETENYEVVRCGITMGSQVVQGVTFRFVGDL